MSFKLPTFNLLCRFGAIVLLGPPYWAPGPRVSNQPCQLTWGRRVNTSSGVPGGGFTDLQYVMSLLLPPLVDIRGPQDTTNMIDAVEVPQGSGRWYQVIAVDDVGKGFANEHRSAALFAFPGSWVAPYP